MITRIVDRLADRIRWGYFIAFILLLTSYILSFYTTKRLLAEADRVNHTYQVMKTIDVMLSSIKDAESGLRGYAVMHDDIFLDQYYTSHHLTDSLVFNLENLTSDNNVQMRSISSLRQMVKAKYDFMEQGLQVLRMNSLVITDSFKTIGYKAKHLMDSIRQITVVMNAREKQLMQDRGKSVAGFSELIKVINIVSLIVAILLAFYSIITFNKENRARRRADVQADAFRQQLERRVLELDTLNTELVELKSIEKFAATGRIARTIAHEVRNPLTNINLATEQLKAEIVPNSETELLIEMITRNSNRINHLISELLNSTKASQLDFKPTSLNALLEESLTLAKDRIELKGISVIKNLGEGIPPLHVDAEKMKIALLNIIVNSIEAMPQHSGILTLRTLTRNNFAVITIQDTGKGMSKEELSKLFEPYFTTKENGTGLGLTNTQNILLSHKAKIGVQSEPGKGTIFTITFENLS